MKALSLAVCLAGLGACTTAPPAAQTAAIAFDRDKALASVNAFRAENGLRALTVEPRLTRVAEDQSAVMAARGRMDHDVAGALPERMKTVGYAWSTTAENVGRSYRDYAAAMAGWEHSPGHRANLLNPAVTEVGFGAARDVRSGTPYWTQTFAAPSKRGR